MFFIQLSLSDKYMVYRLIRKSNPYKPYVRGHGNWQGKEVHGVCELEFLFEAESVSEIFEQKPIMELFYMCGDKNVKPFVMDEEYTFGGLSVYSEKRSVSYHAEGISPIAGEHAFEYIYKTYHNEIVLVISEWNRAHIKDMQIVFTNRKTKQYHLWYELTIVNE